MMDNTEFVAKLKDIAANYKTLYVMGCFGAPMTAKNKARYTQNNDYNRQPARTAMINAASADTFGFDCVCLIKGVLWGWNGDKTKAYGGAGYAVNGVPDIGANSMIAVCKDVSTDFSKIEIGEAVWLDGHIGVYIGGGLAVECSPKWANKVQITAVGNIGKKTGYNTRTWTKHGKLPYITYTADSGAAAPATGANKTVDELAREVLAGKWGNGDDRKKRLTAAGHDYAAVQKRVNEIVAESKFQPYKVQVITNALNIRSGPGTDNPVIGVIRDKGTYTIVAESDGKGASKWGRLENGKGWIGLGLTKKV